MSIRLNDTAPDFTAIYARIRGQGHNSVNLTRPFSLS